MTTLEILFWIFLFIIFYTYLGYGILLYILVKIKELFYKPTQPVLPATDNLPDVTLFIAAYNEEDQVNKKMQNSLDQNYPSEKLHITWITDGSNDSTNEKLKAWPQANILFQPKRQGKTMAINRGMQFIKTPIVIFTDANTMINKDAVIAIVQKFADPKVGCVAGEKRIINQEQDNAAGGGEGIYWKYESTLKALDARLYSAVGAAGELFAIRRELFQEMGKDTLLDDFILSLRIAMQGYKIAYCSNAYACEAGSANIKEEKKRKIRIAAGGLQSIWRLRGLLNPFKYGVLSFQYLSHRVLRWSITPILLFALLPLNIILLIQYKSPVMYGIILTLQVLFYLLAGYGEYLSNKEIKIKILFIPYYFFFMNISVLRSVPYLLRKPNKGVWEKAKRAK